MKYKFSYLFLAQVISHIASYDIKIISMIPIGVDYEIELELGISEDELQHLKDSYNLQEVA
jgi:hypothetical protein